MTNRRYEHTWDYQQVPETQEYFVVNRKCMKPNLVTPEVPPLLTYKTALPILPQL